MDIRLLKNTDKIHKNFNGAFDELEECIFKHPEITKVVVFGIAVDVDCHIEITDSVSKMLFMAEVLLIQSNGLIGSLFTSQPSSHISCIE